jgi:hypothetical protein
MIAQFIIRTALTIYLLVLVYRGSRVALVLLLSAIYITLEVLPIVLRLQDRRR